MKKIFKKIANAFKMQSLKDPIKHCPLYKSEGCAFVDNHLCDYPNCSILDRYYLNVYKDRVNNVKCDK